MPQVKKTIRLVVINTNGERNCINTLHNIVHHILMKPHGLKRVFNKILLIPIIRFGHIMHETNITFVSALIFMESMERFIG